VILAISASSAFAHPTDQDFVCNIPTNSKFIRKSDLNLLPNSQAFFRSIQTKDYFGRSEVKSCFVKYPYSEVDRLAKAVDVNGKALEYSVTHVACNGTGGAFISLSSNLITSVYCSTDTTIGELRQIFAEDFDIQVAAPEVVYGD
jgi:hypothetical protein